MRKTDEGPMRGHRKIRRFTYFDIECFKGDKTDAEI